MTDSWIILGLGNPGAKYQGTRHNVGQMVVDHMATAAGEKLKASRKARCDVAETRLGDQKLILAVPHSYMNESGGPASSVRMRSRTASSLASASADSRCWQIISPERGRVVTGQAR